MLHWHLVSDLRGLPEGKPVPMTVGATRVVLLRTGQTIAALQDRCPHRFAPLSLGKVVDGALQCAYHGLRFGLDGRCVFNPHGNGVVPAAARVVSYPVEQRGGQVFVGLEGA